MISCGSNSILNDVSEALGPNKCSDANRITIEM